MSDRPDTPAVPPATGSVSSLRMILTMGGIGLMCAILIVVTFQATLGVITHNKKVALEKAIFEVVPGAESRKTFALTDGRLEPLAEGSDALIKYYACYDGGGAFIGVAIEASGQGFQDILRVLYGYSPPKSAVVGMKVLESKETPGLGDKIETDPDFRANFDALAVELGEDAKSIKNPIELVKPGKKTDGWQIESITGATISSRAIATILQKSTEATAPIIADNMQVLEEGGED